MSFREKTAWISILSMGAIYALYFRSTIRSGSLARGVHFGGLLETVIALVIVQVALTIAVAIMSPKEAGAAPDERDKLISLRSTRFSYALLSGCVACACFFAAFTPPIVFNTNVLLFILVMAEILRSASVIVQYRRGA